MIKGLTHDENGVANKVTKYRGKISTGYGPKEPPNTTNAPQAAGFFRLLKEITKNQRVGSKTIPVKEWVLNTKAQEALEKSLPTPNKMPRRIEVVCLYKTVDEMWESSMALYSGTDGLMCKSHGKGTPAKYLSFDSDGERVWSDREFNGVPGCAYDECPDFISKKCKPIGLFKCFPVVDLTPNPYRFETRSINTIIGIESSFQDLNSLLMAAHAVKQMEAKKTLPYDGFFGAKLYLVHQKVKSGGRDVFITNLMPTPEFTESVMEPIKRGLADKAKGAKMLGAGSSLTALEEAGAQLLSAGEAEEAVVIDKEDEKSIATSFGADADKGEAGDLSRKAMETLLNDDGKSPEK